MKNYKEPEIGSAVDIVQISKQYGSMNAVLPTTISIAAGEFFSIIGPSGSGKSTLLGIIAGYIEPTSGRVEINGRNIIPQPIYRRNIGMVFQNYALFPHLSVAENIAFSLKMRRLPNSEIRERVDQALAMVRLESFKGRKPAELSGGQQQRVALARAAIYKPRLLLMDEPLGALDKNLRDEMQEEIKRFQAELGVTVIYVTHDQQEAAFLSDRIGIMKDGAMVQMDSPRSLYEFPKSRFVASFLGEASVFPITSFGTNESSPTVVIDGGLTVHLHQAVSSRRAGFVCLRPENVVIGESAVDLDNTYDGEVTEALYTAGSIRYRIRTSAGVNLVSRMLPHTGFKLYEVGRPVKVGWSKHDVCIIE